MTIDNLKTTLQELHRQLANAGSVDGELKDMLQILDQDIRKLLDQNNAESGDGLLSQRAQELSARLAAQHPQLELLLRELANTLERIGI